MARRRSIQSALCNFLGTLSSRNSDWDGYWVFGLVVAELGSATTNLLSEADIATDAASWTVFVHLARQRFREQMTKNHVAAFIRSAHLEATRSDKRTNGIVNGCASSGYDVTLSARVVSDLARTSTSRISFFVAPHDAAVERRSVRREAPSVMP